MLGACFERHRQQHPDGDQWMLTLTPPHRASDATADVLRWQYAASARFFRSAEWRRFAERWRIRSRVRVLDATHGGPHGTHPHFHVALFADAATLPIGAVGRYWLDEEQRLFREERRRRQLARRQLPRRSTELRRAEETDAGWETEQCDRMIRLYALTEELEGAGDDGLKVRLNRQRHACRKAVLRDLEGPLLVAWRRELAAVGCPHAVSSHAVQLSPSEAAERYFVKWGLAEEIGMPAAKDRSHLRLLDVVIAGGAQAEIAAELYRRFTEDSKGKAWVTGLADACRVLGVDDEVADEYIADQRAREQRIREREGKAAPPTVRALNLEVRGKLWRAFLDLGHERVFAELDTVEERARGFADENGRLQAELEHILRTRQLELAAARFGDTS
jgi:hypothetical protein